MGKFCLRKILWLIMTGNKFCFVAPMYNAANTLERFFYSIVGQSYDNWKIILIDDISDEHNKLQQQQIISKFHIDESKLKVIWNTEKLWEVANVLQGINTCDDEDIICRIDADDWLSDLDALYFIDNAYKQTGAEALWTAHRWGFTDFNISAYLPPNANAYKHPWVTSHLKTFRKKLINNVNDVNFRGEDGEYIKRAGDQAIYLPVLYNTQQRVFLPRCVYHYTIKTDDQSIFHTTDAKFQKNEAEFLRQRGYVI